MGLDQRLGVPLLAGEQIETEREDAEPAWTALVLGESSAVAGSHGEPPRGAIFPGAFHPLHEGHRGIVAVGEKLLGKPVALEISIYNVDKPPLDFVEIRRRIDGLEGRPVWLTRAATFVEKAAIFPGATFLVGADTVARIADPKYCGGDEWRMREAIDSIGALGCRFLVFGRQMEGEFKSLAELGLPAGLLALCQAVPGSEFHEDISSTEIRSSDQA